MRTKISLLLICLIVLFVSISLPAQQKSPEPAADTTLINNNAANADSAQGKDTASHSIKEEFENNILFQFACIIAFLIFLGWLLIIVVYYIWAIHFYVKNYGLSNREWKVLYPEIYCSSEKQKIKFQDIRTETIKKRQEELWQEDEDLQTATPIVKPMDEPPENPYTKDSFGLPPGTIRGTLALTALVMFLLIEGVNLFSSVSLEPNFSELLTALKMVLAFYFGSKAVDALKTSETAQSAETKEATKPETPKTTKTITTSTLVEEELPNEKPAMPSRLSETRLTNIAIVPKADEGESVIQQNKDATLAQRVLSLTATFETGQPFPACYSVVTGNFDNQGLSFGALQWNIGQGSLQPIFRNLYSRHDKLLKSVLGSYYNEFIFMLSQPLEQQLLWAKSIQFRTSSENQTAWKITPDWFDIFSTLGKTQEMIDIQVEAALARFNIALANCDHFKLTTERGAALMFDINVQNGRVGVKNVEKNIWADYNKLTKELSPGDLDVERMKIIAKRRAEVSTYRWREDVRSRKMTIAEGKGNVHGKVYDLEKEFNITLKPMA